MFTLYDGSRLKFGSKSLRRLSLAMMSLLLCLSFSPEVYGHAAAPVAPTAPSALTATTMSNARIDLAWTDNAANEDGFKIEIKVGAAGVYSELEVVGANVNTYSSTGLEASTQYFYRVRAFNVDGNSAFSNQANATTLPDPPVAPGSLSAGTFSNTQINLTWTDNSNNEDGFKIERKLNTAVTYTQIATVSTNVTIFSNTGLATNTGYSYRVRAYNTGGNSGYSNAATATTLPNPPNAPANLTATAMSNKRVDLAWADNASDELGFIVERKTGSGGVYGVIDSVNANVTTFSNAALTGGTQYFFRVRAYNAGGASDYTNEANATTQPDVPTAPTNLTATAASNDQINLAWADNSSNEDGFKIEVKIGSFGTYSEIDMVTANVTSYASSGLEAGIPYFYRVRAFNVSGNSGYSNEVNAFTLPDPPATPSGLAAMTVSNTAIGLAWTDNANNEDGFKIERRLTTAVSYTEIGTVGANVTSFNNTGLTPNTAYSYRVRAINGGGTSSYSNVSSATTFPNPPAAPSNLSATTISNSQIDLGWQDNSTNELGFMIERKAGAGGTFAVIDTVDPNVTNFVSLGLTGSIQYFYRVRAYNTGGASAYSNEANATTMVDPPGTPTNLTATVVNSDQINLAWTENATNELGYKIELKTGTSGTFTEIDEVGPNVTTYQSTGLDANIHYFYRVRAFSPTGFSGYSNVADGITLPDAPPAPSSLAATPVSNAQIDLSWKDNSTSESGFKIERRLNSAATFTQIGTVGPNVTTFSSPGLTANTGYTYRVRAYNASGNSPYSNLVSATTLPNAPNAPTNLTATAENNRQINLAWTDNASNEVGFFIERKTGPGGVYAKIDSVNANTTSYPNIDLIGGTQYFYKVTAYNAGGNSAPSNEANATTLLDPPDTPTNLVATPVSNKRIDLSWTDNADNEDGYKIERKTNAVGSTFAQYATVGPNVATFADTGLTALSTFFYRVVGFNADGQSSYSNEANAKTLPNPPGAPNALTATALSNTKIKLAWKDNASNEDGFKIERKTGAAGLFAEVGTVAPNVKTFTDTSLSALTEFFYRVRAFNAGGHSAYSNEAKAKTLPNPPGAPSNLTATAANVKQINLAWSDNSGNETGFKIERRISTVATFAQIATVAANVKAFADTGLAVNVKYLYRVRAYNAGGNSAFSNTVEAVTLPGAPSALTAATLSNTKIKLDWADNASNEDGYKIERKTGAAVAFAEIATVAANVKTFTDSSLSAVTEYSYRVRAHNAGGHSGYSNEAKATTLPNTPIAPSNLSAMPGYKRVNLAWSDNAGNEDGFKIERRLDTEASFTQIVVLPANVAAYADTILGVSTKYVYRIRAFNFGGHSAFSAEAVATTLPDAPGNLTATTQSNTKINLAWSDNANAEDGFKIERKTGAAGVFADIASVTPNVKTLADTGLSANTEYFYRLRAFNAGGNSAYSNEGKATTLPNIPGAPDSLTTKPGKKRIDLAWTDNSDNETGFKIERRQGTAVNFTQIAILPANAAAFADTGLGVSTKYAYRIRAFNTGGHTPYSAAVEATTLPNPPAASTALLAKTSSSSQIDLSWQDHSTNEGGFKIERRLGNAGTFTQVATVGANVLSFSNGNLNANTKYFYRVRAFNAGGNSAYSNMMEATTLPKAPVAPSNLAVTVVSFSRLNLAWQDKSANEDSFMVERKLGAAGTFAQIAKLPANAVAFGDTGLAASTQYFYRVRASNTGGQSPYSNEANATTNPGAPAPASGLTATPVNQTRIALVWTDNSTNEAGFKIERKIGAGAFAQFGTAAANATSFADTALVANTEYVYRVRAFNVTANSAYTNEATAKTFPVPPAAPAGLTAGPMVNLQINLTWQDKSTNEDSFRLERKLGAAGAFAPIARLAKNTKSHADSALSPVTQYFYRVRASNLGGHSAYSNEATATTLVKPPTAPSNLTATTASQTQINLAWTDNANDEDGFKIERGSTSSPQAGSAVAFAEIASVAPNVKTYQDNGLSQDVEYVYRVRAFNAGGNAGYSNAVTAITLPNAPKAPVSLTGTPVSNKRINLAWADSSKNEGGFKIERKKGAAGTYAQIATVNANVKTYADTTLLPATPYFYRVRAFNIGGNSGYSNEANATTLPNPPKKPANLTATPVSNKRINLAWVDSSNNENGFRIERKKGVAGTYAQIAQVNANVKTYVDSTLTASTAYFYRVRAFNTGGNSLYSNEATATTLPNPPKAPAKLTATAVSKTRINLAWADSSDDETGFRIERKIGAAGTYAQVGSVNANVKSFADTSLTGGTPYFYRVRAFNTGGNSAYSNEANAKTFPNAPAGPTALAATVAGGDQVTIAWQDNSNDEDGFKVESKLGADGTYTQVATVGPNVTNYESTDLTEGVTYFYRVRAFNLGGNSAYSNEASAIPSSGTNFALNKPVVASSSDSTSAAGKAVDGDGVSFWRSGFVNASSAVVTFQVQLHPTLSITVGRVVIKWYQTYYANEYDIEVSNDASNWTIVHSALAVVTGTQDIPVTATPAKYVRLQTKKNNKSNYRIAEFEVYGATVTKAVGDASPTVNEAIIPESLVLEQNYPNPFNPSTTISFGVPEGMHVTLKVINAVGQEVASLVDGYRDRGMHRVTFNGRKLPSGVYYAVMKAGETTQTKRMVLAK